MFSFEPHAGPCGIRLLPAQDCNYRKLGVPKINLGKGKYPQERPYIRFVHDSLKVGVGNINGILNVFWRGSKVYSKYTQRGSAQCAQECYGELHDQSFFYVEDPAARPDTGLILVGIVKLEDPAFRLKSCYLLGFCCSLIQSWNPPVVSTIIFLGVLCGSAFPPAWVKLAHRSWTSCIWIPSFPPIIISNF